MAAAGFSAGGLEVVAFGVERGGDVADPVDGAFQISGDLVSADEQHYLPGAE